VRLTSTLTTEGIPLMPHHIEDGDNAGSQTCHPVRNQLGTPGRGKSFLRGAQIF